MSTTTTTSNSSQIPHTNTSNNGSQAPSVPKMPPAAEKVIKVLTTPSVHVSALMTTVLVCVTQNFMNAMLLGPWNSVRCSFWNKASCSQDEAWILNWYCFAKFHLCALLFAFGASTAMNTTAWMETKVGFLTITVLACTLTGGVFSLEHISRPMAAFQAMINIAFILVLFYWISVQELQPGSAYLSRAMRSRSLSMSTSHRQKIAIPTVSLGFQLVLSIFRAVDMTFGSSKDGYLGNSSG